MTDTQQRIDALRERCYEAGAVSWDFRSTDDKIMWNILASEGAQLHFYPTPSGLTLAESFVSLLEAISGKGPRLVITDKNHTRHIVHPIVKELPDGTYVYVRVGDSDAE